MPQCTACGQELAPGVKFCGACGAPIPQQAAPAPPPEAPLIVVAAPVAPVFKGPDRRKFARNAGIVGLIGFVLPWVSCNGGGGLSQTMSGMDLANAPQGGGGLLWLVALGLGLAVLLALLAQPAVAAERASRAKITIAGGVVTLVVMFVEYTKIKNQTTGNGMFGSAMDSVFSIQFGAYISAAAALGVILGGLQQLSGAKRDGG